MSKNLQGLDFKKRIIFQINKMYTFPFMYSRILERQDRGFLLLHERGPVTAVIAILAFVAASVCCCISVP